MIDLDALSRAAGQAARPRTDHVLLAARTVPHVHVITTLGGGDYPAVRVQADIFEQLHTARDAYTRWARQVRVTTCQITHTGPPCPGNRCTWRRP